jgi:AcrR family transcriptional regulator
MTEGRSEAPSRSPRDPSATIGRIIAAAREEFGAHGFDGAKVEHIARRARVSKQLVYLYFAGKDELYGELLKVIARENYQALLAIDFAALAPVDAIRTYIETIYDRFRADPVMAVVTLDQSMHEGAQIRFMPDLNRMREAFVTGIEDALARGRRSGAFGAHVDLAGLEFMTVIIVTGCVSSRGMFARHLGQRGDAHEPGYWRDYAVDFILRALRA